MANVLSKISKIILLQNVLFYLIYFYIGFLFEGKRKEINEMIDTHTIKNYMYSIILLGILFILLERYDCVVKYFEVVHKILRMILAILEIYVVYITAYKLSKINTIAKNKIIETISKYSFGIYLYSDPLNYIILFISNNYFEQYMSSAIGITTLFFFRVFATLGVAMGITYVLRKTKIKYIC